MDKYRELEILLDTENEDQWSDETCEIARRIIDDNNSDVFNYLEKQIGHWSPHRLTRLAYILGESQDKGEIELINKLAKSEIKEVRDVADERKRYYDAQ